MSGPPPHPYTPPQDGNQRQLAVSLQAECMKLIKQKGYPNVQNKDVFYNFPTDVTGKLDLLGEYVSQTPFCAYLEKTNHHDQLQIKFNGESIYDDLNTMLSILGPNLKFLPLILVFNYDRSAKNNFLKVSHIIQYGVKILPKDTKWTGLIRNCYTQLIFVTELLHSFWHLMTAQILTIVQKLLNGLPILKVFEMAEKNVFQLAIEVDQLIFGSSVIFGQILNDNSAFQVFKKQYFQNFYKTFDIDTIFKTYLIHDLNPKQKWILGMPENIRTIGQFANLVFEGDKSANTSADALLHDFMALQNDFPTNTTVKQLLQMLFVIGSSFHSTTFEFVKIALTDLLYQNNFSWLFYSIILTSVATNIDTVFADVKLYKGHHYTQQVKFLHKQTQIDRKRIEKEVSKNTIYKGIIFTTKPAMIRSFATNTYTTYV